MKHKVELGVEFDVHVPNQWCHDPSFEASTFVLHRASLEIS